MTTNSLFLYLKPNRIENFLFLDTFSNVLDIPKKFNFNEYLFSIGSLYLISKTDDILSPYLASKPPAENLMSSVNSELIKLSPSCWPDLIKKGLYTSMPFTYTRFSS